MDHPNQGGRWPELFLDHIRLCLLILLILPRTFSSSDDSDFDDRDDSLLRTVQTTFGVIHGRLLEFDETTPRSVGAVAEYLGVPYAQPPLGRKRFMPPNSASKWSTAKDATRFQPVCVQKFPRAFASGREEALRWMPESYYRFMSRMKEFVRNEAEDCLYLNLYVPERKGNRPSGALPVLVLVHGGSYSWGTGNAYNASVLAGYGQLIVVTLNYRLGIFGFLSAGYQAPTCRGNWALGDIAAALEFLRQTVHDFGGDPRAITLMGWDTGAALVNLLASSPVSAPAHSRSFQRAILLGGSALSSWATVANPTDAYFYVAESLGCVVWNKNREKNGKRRMELPADTSIHDITNCLMAASVDNITRAVREIEPPTYLNVFGPSIDGSIVANDPQHNLRQHGDLFRELDLLVGVTKNEAFHLLGNHELTHGMDRSQRDSIYRTLVQNTFKYHRNEIAAAITDEYTDWRKPMAQKEDVRTSVLRALSDGLFVSPTINAARVHARPKRSFDEEDEEGRGSNYARANSQTSSTNSFSSKHGTTFMYVFSHETNKGLDRGRISDAVHGEDLPYILGYPLLERQAPDSLFNYTFGNVERSLSEAMMRYISNFARTGDPTRPNPVRGSMDETSLLDSLSQLVWPPFIADVREAYVELGEQPREGVFYRAHEIAFWTKFLPSLEKAGESASNERHHQFPNKSTYYGHVRSMDRFVPFWQTTTVPPTSTMLSTAMETTVKPQISLISTTPDASSESSAASGKYSTILSVTVAVGCALLILNVLIFAGIYHQWDKQKRFRKRLNNHYQSQPNSSQSRLDLVSSGPGGGGLGGGGLPAGNALNSTGAPQQQQYQHASLDRTRTLSYSLASPVGPMGGSGGGVRVPPPPPPPLAVSSSTSVVTPPMMSANSLDSDLHPTFSIRQNHHPNRNSIRPQQHQPQQPPPPPYLVPVPMSTPIPPPLQLPGEPGGGGGVGGETPRGVYSEQEPLLNRSFISPTCPRHGKQAAAQAAAHAAMAAMEEIQV